MDTTTGKPTPPVAGERPHSFTRHGVTIDDPWHWLRDAAYPAVEDPDVLAYLAAENEYFEARMSPHRELTDTIFEEIKARQQPDLSSVPWKCDDWYYQWRYEEEGQYRVWQRWPAEGPNAREGPTSDAQTILDEPALAKGLEYFILGSVSVSNGGSLMAYSTDTNGSERFRMVVKDLGTGELLAEEIEDTTGGAAWAADDASVLLRGGRRELASARGSASRARRARRAGRRRVRRGRPRVLRQGVPRRIT